MLIFLSAIMLLKIDVSSSDKGFKSPVIFVFSRLALAASSSLAEVGRCYIQPSNL